MANAEFADQVPGAQPSFPWRGTARTSPILMTNWAEYPPSPAIASYAMFANDTYDRVGREKEVTGGFSTDAVTEAGSAAMGAALRDWRYHAAGPAYALLHKPLWIVE